MIISHKHKFIFIKTKKTAGTSIEIALSKFCGPEDIITPISEKDEEVRRRLGYPPPQNYLKPLREYGLRDWLRLLLKFKKAKKFFNHMSAEEIKSQVGEKVWQDYYKFCFERNPWDKVVSLYKWETRNNPEKLSFHDYLNTDRAKVLSTRGGYNLYSINGVVVVDRVCRFENLRKDLAEICKILNLPEEPFIPKTKNQYRKSSEDYRSFYFPDGIDRVRDIFDNVITYLNYSF